MLKISSKLIVALLFLLNVSFALPAYSQIWIEEQQQAEFPLTLIPNSRKKIVLKPNGNIGGGTTAEIVGGTAMSGHYVISSDSDKTISINVTSNGDDPSIKLKNFKVVYMGQTYRNLPVAGLPSPGSGRDLFIGFTAILKTTAGEGERFPSYTIDVVED